MKSRDPCRQPFVLLHVLVADRGISANDSLTGLLSEFEGLSVVGCVQEPAKVLALARKVRPDVVILDLQTEGAAGLKTLKQIKRLPRAPVVIVLSDYDLPPLRQAALAAGADDFLSKATECERLPKVLHGLLPKARSARSQTPKGQDAAHKEVTR
jgi:DNA-binding NarL/FixJ family response regulator